MLITTIFDTVDALNTAARRALQKALCAEAAVPTAVIVPGGATPIPLFQSVVSAPFIPGDTVHLGYTDERYVPVTDPGSNFGLTRAMIEALGLPSDRVFRVATELPLEEAANAYHETWRRFLAEGGVIPIALLGLGADGHTCSLFSPEQLRDCPEDRYAVPVTRDPGPDRITITPALLRRVGHVAFLVTGQNKAAVVDAMTAEGSEVAAARAVAGCARVSIWFAPGA